MQELLDDYRGHMNAALQDKLTAVLGWSYERLPSDAHRLMFLDAALLLRGRPPAQLTAVWEGQLLLNESVGDNQGPFVRQLPARLPGQSRAEWQACQQRAASGKAAKVLAHLEKLVLVRSETYEDPYGRKVLR